MALFESNARGLDEWADSLHKEKARLEVANEEHFRIIASLEGSVKEYQNLCEAKDQRHKELEEHYSDLQHRFGIMDL